MRDYLVIVRKVDFADLFKYGYINVNHPIEFDGTLDPHDDSLFEQLTHRMGMYEYSFEYLILHFNAKEDDRDYITVDIRNVCNLYTFDLEAKKEMEVSFGPRIELQVSPWADKFAKLQQQRAIDQGIRGIDNLWPFFGLADELRLECKKIITKDIAQEVFRELFANERPHGKQSLWTYLLRYERHNYYPKNTFGFFCDVIHVFCNYTVGQENNEDIIESTDIYLELKNYEEDSFITLAEITSSSQLGRLTHEASGCNFAVAAPLFLYLKDLFTKNKGGILNLDEISCAKNIGELEYSIAVYLLGLVLGYEKTCDIFYETAALPFLKKGIATTALSQHNRQEGKTPRIQGKSKELYTSVDHPQREEEKQMAPYKRERVDNELGNLFSELSEDLQEPSDDLQKPSKGRPAPIEWVKKGRGKNFEVRPVLTKEDHENYINLQYELIEKFSTPIKDRIKKQGYNPDEEEKRLIKSSIV